ncbi:TSUP family transporter [Flavobacterium columnare]|uniref:Probable membrane transporter protein n=1 Tax=Flavobacterium columnare TaxID=996 RepID=A0AA94F2Q0_9FLAO|nr:TSUP family transporter [Flavobacterium columnare]MCH4829250.1 TSUP family transporter [Flavobacterium columnare]MCH4834026.1 TSUP family transporter [Flavobacterium columnare]
MDNNTLFPIFLKTESKRFLIVGGGNVALEKTETLLKQNPNVFIKLVGKEIFDTTLLKLRNEPSVQFEERSFQETDLENIDFVIAATNDKEVNVSIKKLANARQILVNAADQPDLCDFYLGSIVNKGNMKIAISTNGKSPVLARRMREFFTDVIPDSIEENLDSLNALRDSIKGDFQQKLELLNQATEALDPKKEKKAKKKYQRLAFQLSIVFFAVFLGYGFSGIVSIHQLLDFTSQIPSAFYIMLAVGFFAQLVDGAVGLGYGLTCSTSMMLFGISPKAISGSIHTAEMFSSGISGFSHYRFGNVNKKLLFWLAIPGVIGAIGGALLLVYLGDKYEKETYLLLSIYTLIMGVNLFRLALRKKPLQRKKSVATGFLGFSGGFLDSFGGGGWGPIVTSTLLSLGKKSRYVVGTVSLAEFFVTLAASITFFLSIGVSHWFIIAGLIIGGSIAAPLAAKLVGKVPQRKALFLVAAIVTIWSIKTMISKAHLLDMLGIHF